MDSIVGKYWSSQIRGTNMFRLSQKLWITKQQLKDWSRHFLGNTQQKLTLNAKKIELVEQKLSNQPESYR